MIMLCHVPRQELVTMLAVFGELEFERSLYANEGTNLIYYLHTDYTPVYEMIAKVTMGSCTRFSFHYDDDHAYCFQERFGKDALKSAHLLIPENFGFKPEQIITFSN